MYGNYSNHLIQESLVNAFSHAGESAFTYPCYFAAPDGISFKAFMTPEQVITVHVGEYVAGSNACPHNQDDRNAMRLYEHISRARFMQKFWQAQKTIEALSKEVDTDLLPEKQ